MLKAEVFIDCLEDISRLIYRQWCDETYCQAIYKAIAAAKKTVPQKVTHEATLYKCCTCPYCKNVVDEFTEFSGNKVRVRVEHCEFCGQALDWSEE